MLLRLSPLNLSAVFSGSSNNLPVVWEIFRYCSHNPNSAQD
jgi:hypothetical protein